MTNSNDDERYIALLAKLLATRDQGQFELLVEGVTPEDHAKIFMLLTDYNLRMVRYHERMANVLGEDSSRGPNAN